MHALTGPIDKSRRSKLPYFLAYDEARELSCLSRRKKLSFDEFVTLEYLPYIQKYLKSWRVNEQMLRRHASASFGHRLLRDIKRGEVQTWRSGMLQAGFSISTANRAFAALASVFAYAEYLGFIPFGLSPCYKLGIMPVQRREPHLAHPHQVRELAAALRQNENIAAKAVYLMLLTGARKNEILKAKWSDVDWNHQKLRSRRGTHGPVHWIALSDAAIDILRNLQNNAANDWIFPGKKDGQPISDVFQFWKKLRIELGLPQMTLEDLRHNRTALQLD